MSDDRPVFVEQLVNLLHDYRKLCAETLDLTCRESQALSGSGEYQPFEFFQIRKSLHLRLDQSLNQLRTWRQAWQRVDPNERARQSEVKSLLQAVQDSLVKILTLDRENQQALLRRGLMPARHLPSFGGQQPHYAARLYRRHST